MIHITVLDLILVTIAINFLGLPVIFVNLGCMWLLRLFEKAGVPLFTEFVTLLYAANYAKQCFLCSCLISTFSNFKYSSCTGLEHSFLVRLLVSLTLVGTFL